MDVGVLMTTCDRYKSCQRIVDSLQGKADIYILNDGDDYVIYNVTKYYSQSKFGKMGYADTVNRLFSMRNKHKYYLMIPDDWMPLDNMIERAVELWDGINDRRKMCLNILCPGTEGNMNWTNFPAKDVGTVYQTQWVDMCFICGDLFFNAVGTIPRLNRSGSNKSSGVGAYISRKLHNNRYSMYMVKEKLFTPMDEHFKSQMHVNNSTNSHIAR